MSESDDSTDSADGSIDALCDTPIFKAIFEGRVETIRELVMQGVVDPDSPNNDGMTPVFVAAENGQVDVIKTLADMGADLNTADNDGATPVCVAAGSGQVCAVEILAELGADIHICTSNGTTPTYVAAHQGHEAVIRVLAKLGADLNAPNYNGITPIYIASQEGHVNVIRALAELGADLKFGTVATNDDFPSSPVYIAAQEGHVEVLYAFSELGVDVNTPLDDGTTPMHVAAAANRVDVINMLVELGGGANAATNNGITPLHIAAREGHSAAFQTLVFLGADIDAVSRTGHTAVHIAAMCGHAGVLNIICDLRGGDLEKLNFEGMSPLMVSAQFSQPECFIILLHAGVDIRKCYSDQGLNTENSELLESVREMVDQSCVNDGLVSSMSPATMCCVFSLAKLMCRTYVDLTRNIIVEKTDTLDNSDQNTDVQVVNLLNDSITCLRRVARHNNKTLERVLDTSYLLRRKIVRIAWKILELSMDAPSGATSGYTVHGCRIKLSADRKVSRLTGLVCFLLNEDMLREVLALRFTCKSNSERFRFPVNHSRYEELEPSLVEEWLSYGSSHFVSTSVIFAVLALHLSSPSVGTRHDYNILNGDE